MIWIIQENQLENFTKWKMVSEYSGRAQNEKQKSKTSICKYTGNKIEDMEEYTPFIIAI